MKTEVIYITQYLKDPQTLQKEVTKEYDSKCLICNSTEDLVITTILPEEIYLELSHETWNNILLCKCCKTKLDYKNKKNTNGFKNMTLLIKEEYKNKIGWLKNL